LEAAATTKDFWVVQSEGKWRVQHSFTHYNMAQPIAPNLHLLLLWAGLINTNLT
jgi:hypothetical protein